MDKYFLDMALDREADRKLNTCTSTHTSEQKCQHLSGQKWGISTKAKN